MQGTLIDEKKSGTAAWIMSKPASRTAFIVAKLVANGIALSLIIVIIQSIGVYLQLSVELHTVLPLGQFVAGIGMISLNMLFYVTFTLMLGTWFQDRGPVVGIPIAFVFAPMLLSALLGNAANLTPWSLVPSGGDPGLAVQAMLGMPLTTVLPIAATVVWCVVFVVAAIWRFRRDEF
jgi:ABC-2 type transport system permease protein